MSVRPWVTRNPDEPPVTEEQWEVMNVYWHGSTREYVFPPFLPVRMIATVSMDSAAPDFAPVMQLQLLSVKGRPFAKFEMGRDSMPMQILGWIVSQPIEEPLRERLLKQLAEEFHLG